VFSPWGSVRSLTLEVTPDTTVEELKWQLKSELGLEEMSELVLEVNVPGQSFGEDLIKGTMKENNISKGMKITVVSVEMEHGTGVKSSPATAVKDNTLQSFASDTAPHRRHDKGLNYEAVCPDDSQKLVIVNRGFGSFDWATDPLDLSCPCCDKTINPMKITKIGVNNCEWQWAGISLDGTKLTDKGTTGNGNHWILDDMSVHWRKLVIKTIDPTGGQQEEEEEEITRAQQEVASPDTFMCPLCKQEFPLDQGHALADRKLCQSCVQLARAKLAERDEKRLAEENELRRKERSEKVEKVQLVGLGAQIALKPVPPQQLPEQQNQ